MRRMLRTVTMSRQRIQCRSTGTDASHNTSAILAVLALVAGSALSVDAAPEPMEIIRATAKARTTVSFHAIRHLQIIRDGRTVRAMKQEIIRDRGHKERVETYVEDNALMHLVICDGQSMWEYWPDRNLVIRHATAPNCMASQRTDQCIEVLYQGMKLEYRGRDTVASRPTHVVEIRNGHDELVRRTWVDTQTGVQLRLDKFHGIGQPYMRTVVSSIDYSPHITDDTFAFHRPAGVKMKEISRPPQRVDLQQAEEWAGFDARIPDRLPPGYVFERDAVGVTRYEGKKTLWLTFTNGVDTFSIFEMPCSTDRQVRHGRMGTTQWAEDGLCFMLMGNLSKQDIKRIVHSTR